MVANAALAQLLDMGIPGGRARAALKRSKGDAMAAAERVFAGEYDDISSDDEGEDEPAEGIASTSSIPQNAPIEQRVKGVVLSDAEDEDYDEDFGGFDDDDDDNDDDRRIRSDPYAGIFFSKDRTEVVIETVDKPVELELRVAPPRGSKKPGGTTTATVLGIGEWMSGCPEGNEQSFLFQLYSKLSSEPVNCAGGCGHVILREPKDFFVLLVSYFISKNTDFPAYLAHLTSVIRPVCPQCQQVTCLACGNRCEATEKGSTPPAIDMRGKSRPLSVPRSSSGIDELLHCVDLQGVIIGMGLFMIEKAFGEEKPAMLAASITPPAKKRRKSIKDKIVNALTAPVGHQSVPDEGDSDFDDDYGYSSGTGTKSAAGTGYAGAGNEDRSGQKAAEEAQRMADAKTADLLAQVKVYLPQVYREGGARTSDHLVHPTALAHLRRRSGFVNNLLRNDSLLDMSNRGDLYRALFDWLEIVSSHEALASMLAMPQMRPASTKPVPSQPDQVSVTYEGASSPRELLESVVIQARAALKGLEATAAKQDVLDEQDEEEKNRMSMAELIRLEEQRKRAMKKDENEQLRVFCNRIISSSETIDRSLVDTKGKEFVQRMQQSLPRLADEDGAGTGSSLVKIDAGANVEAVMKIYEDWVKKVRFQYADLSIAKPSGGMEYKHAFSSMVTALENQDMPKRSLAIAKELAILTTNLPVAWHSSIFLRVDEARVDCIKAMIIGPEGTPYENGCFIFDIFLPLEYNFKCPHVKSMTTNGGRYRYNPNLYADGKVCLSLLGTWQGPGWISGQSTLLQVLISIQSLILCEEPFCNEPGWANGGGSPASKAYSANVRRMVLVDAMANNIKNPPSPFENEIKTHFRLKASSILEQLKKWESLDDGKTVRSEGYYPGAESESGSRSGGVAFEPAANELRALLAGLDEGVGTAKKTVDVKALVGKKGKVGKAKK